MKYLNLIRNAAMAMVALAAVATASADQEQDFYTQTRFDYFDKEGNRVYSAYGSGVSGTPFSIESGYIWTGPFTEFHKMVMVPGYTESYELSIVPEQISTDPAKQIKVGGFTILDSEDAPARDNVVAKASDNEITSNLKSGTRYKFYIDVPEGMLPSLTYVMEYTGNPEYTTTQYPFIYDTKVYLGNSNGNIPVIDWMQSYRYTVAQYIKEGNDFAPFEPDPNVPNRYWITDYKYNEPETTIVSAVAIDAEWVEDVIDNLFSTLYSSIDGSQQYLGETMVTTWVGDFLGGDYISSFFTINREWATMFLPLNFDSNTYYLNAYPFYYCMTLVEKANFALDLLNKIELEDTKTMEIARASCEALRSHAYLRLLQIYGNRFEESDNMQAKCAPLLTSFTNALNPEWTWESGNSALIDTSLASMQQIYDQCMDDLQTAAAIFEKYNYTKTDIKRIDATTTYGIMSRFALLAHDWQKAAEYADKVLENVPNVMSNEEFQAGFFAPSTSWIWGAGEPYIYMIWQNWWACNGYYSASFGMGTGRINWDLYSKLSDNDIRKKQFLTYDNFKMGPANKNHWFSNSWIEESNVSLKRPNFIEDQIKEITPEGCDYPNSRNMNYPYYFGMQFKFFLHNYVEPELCDKIPFMRAEEMVLTCAEAYCELGQYAKAAEYLNRLNSVRTGEDYQYNGNADELRDAIRLNRRIELWGEGFNFFDYKRWKMPLTRKAWQPTGSSDDNSNIPAFMAIDTDVNACNQWRLPLPQMNYYNGLDFSQMKYDIEYDYSIPESQSKLPYMGKQDSASDSNKQLNIINRMKAGQCSMQSPAGILRLKSKQPAQFSSEED